MQFEVWDCSLVFTVLDFRLGFGIAVLGMGLQFGIYWVAVWDLGLQFGYGIAVCYLLDCRFGFNGLQIGV